MKRIAGLALLAACGSGGGEGISWRLPCGGEGFQDGTLTVRYVFEHDDRGNVTHELATDATGGAVLYEIDAEYDGHLATHYDYDSDGLSYVIDAVVDGGQTRSVVYVDRIDAGSGYQETWTWDGDALQTVERDYEADGAADTIETYAAAAGGFSFDSCPQANPDDCDRYTLTGADFVGDFRHWTVREADFLVDEVVDVRLEQTFVQDDLVLTADAHVLEVDTLVHASHTTYDREADGTALRMRRQDLSVQPATEFRIEYSFECDPP
jgi:hypothetical protein